MRSHSQMLRRVFAACMLSGLLCIGIAHAQERLSEPPTTQQVEAAVEQLRADPNIAPDRTTRTLKWKTSKEKSKPSPGWLSWLGELFSWFGESARILVWIVIALLIAGLTLAVVRQLRSVDLRRSTRRSDAPTHVRDLDIRPESLPDDIGGTALGLWERGEARAALSLLYRGLLSRLAHTYEVPIRDSSTEGDCLRLAEHHLQQERVVFASRLIRLWQRATYGGRDPDGADVRGLCSDFSATLPATHDGVTS